MELRVLRYFLETAREGNMTRAAKRLFISQPTMSKQLKELEDELGVKLFVRSNYSIKLTEAGILLKERAEDIISLVDKTEAEFKSFENMESGEIYIGAPESDYMSLFTEAVLDIQMSHPKIRCNIHSGNLEDVCDRLDKGLLDFAIVLSFVDRNKYDYIEMPAKDSWGIILRKDDPLASKKTFNISELKGLPLICSNQWISHEFPQWFGLSKDKVNIVATYNLAFNASIMTKTGMGYSIVLDKLIDTGESSKLTFRPLNNVPHVPMYVIWRKNQTFTAAAELLLGELQKRFTKPPIMQ